jgi:mRNA-degrading endonuclease RelE of RelBE toxin-antitoxin system
LSHRAAKRFWRTFADLPDEIQKLARENFELLKSNPHHPSLHFKRVGKYWSARIGGSYRALGQDSAAGIVWFWIGPHEEYERLIHE